MIEMKQLKRKQKLSDNMFLLSRLLKKNTLITNQCMINASKLICEVDNNKMSLMRF